MVVDWLWVIRGDFKALHEKLERWWSLKWDRKWKEEQVCWETNMLPKSSNTEAGTQGEHARLSRIFCKAGGWSTI